jgi:hypothetical protein
MIVLRPIDVWDREGFVPELDAVKLEGFYLRVVRRPHDDPCWRQPEDADRIDGLCVPIGIVQLDAARLAKVVPIDSRTEGAEFDRRLIDAGLLAYWRPMMAGDEPLPWSLHEDLDCEPGTFVVVERDPSPRDHV